MSDLCIVSLVPSATETVFRLGAGDAMVGRSHVCDFPAEARELPVLTRPRLESTSSRGIHDELRARLSEGLAIYDVDLDRLRTLEPTHLLLQDQCSVCAVSPDDLETALSEWLGARPRLVSVAPQQLHEVWQDIQTIGDAIGRPDEAKRLRRNLSERVSEIAEAVGATRAQSKVACIEWLDPLMIAGHWVPELIRIAGGQPLLAQTGGASQTIDLETLVESSPDVLVLQICGFDLPTSQRAWQTDERLRVTLARWPDPKPRLFITDGDAFFNRPGPRLVESAEILAEILNPGKDERGHRGRHFIEVQPER